MNKTGILTCSAYASPPNALHYCGPEKQIALTAYQNRRIADHGLTDILIHFETLYPYLKLIAEENDIRDPFDPRVVEAYWIGNSLLRNISIHHFYTHLHDTLNLKKKVKVKDLERLYGKLPIGLLPHHTFHVLNVFTRTGHRTVEHTLETMDACRIGWGRVIKITNYKLQTTNEFEVETQPLTLKKGKLTLAKPIVKKIKIPYRMPDFGSRILEAYLVSFHWNTLCDILTFEQVRRLTYYTNQAIALANQTI